MKLNFEMVLVEKVGYIKVTDVCNMLRIVGSDKEANELEEKEKVFILKEAFK